MYKQNKCEDCEFFVDDLDKYICFKNEKPLILYDKSGCIELDEGDISKDE